MSNATILSRACAGLALVALSAVPAMADDYTFSAEEQAVYDALLRRDGAPTCDELAGMTLDPVGTYRVMIEHAVMPPWVGVRAADCLVTEHSVAAREDLEAWVQDPELLGLALIALNGLDKMDHEVAMGVARAALEGPLAEQAGDRILKSMDDEIRGLVVQPGEGAPITE